MQFFCSPIMGMLSDRFGRRPVLLISIFGLGVDYLFMAFAPTLAWLFVGRLINGVTSASFSTAGAYIADITTPENRAKSFGLLGAAFGVGFIIGPAIGGFLGDIDLRLPFYFAAGMALINWMYGYLILPESLPPERRAPRFVWAKANPVGSFRLLRSHKDLIGLAGVGFLFQLAHNVFPSIFVLYTGDRFGWSPGDIGLMLMATGLTSAAVQFLLVGPAHVGGARLHTALRVLVDRLRSSVNAIATSDEVHLARASARPGNARHRQRMRMPRAAEDRGSV
jgi:DHA1 family tetracycline resistance protein-like MFS transporter